MYTKEEKARRKKQWTLDNPDRVREHNRASTIRRKRVVIDHYGSECVCCHESEIEFLGIDHKNGGGTQHRKEVGGGYAFYAWVIRNGFPDDLQVLCHNCNMATAHGRVCPHQRNA